MANISQVMTLHKHSIFSGHHGTEEWNTWRAENPNIEIDLSNAELQNINLKNINLEKADLKEINFKKADLNCANLERADLSSAHLNSAKLSYANLNFANLNSANLENSSLNSATLNSAKLYFAKLSHANLENAHLENADLYSTKLDSAKLNYAQLENADFNSANLGNAELNSANFKNADLENANLENANLNFADLNSANLKNASLLVVTALGASFKNTTLTGACIEDWNINSKTNFEDVVCDYIYLKWDKEKKKPTERRPSDPNRNFLPGEFTKLFQKVHETVDLIFSNGIDWQAFLSSYQDIQYTNNYNELDMRAIKKSSDGSFIIRVDVPENANKANLEAEFYQRYEGELKRLEEVYQKELQAKDREIESYRRESANMTEIAKLLASRPITVETKAVAGDEVNQSGSFGIGQMKGGEITGDAIVAGTYNEVAQDIKTLINQLKNNYDSTPLGNMQMGTEIVDHITQNSSLKQRVIKAIQDSPATFEKAIDHPVAAVIIAGLQGFTETEK